MKDYQIAQLKMMQEVERFFTENPNLEKDNKILKNHVEKLRTYISDIEKNEMKQQFDNTGYAENKKQAKQELANTIVNITASICSFATDTGKNELYNEFKPPISSVKTMSDNNIVNYANTVVATAKKYKTELKPYNVTAEEITALTNKTSEYENILLIPAQERKEKKVATANIKKLISETLQLLKRSIDNDMMHYKDTQSDLYNKYINMREIDDSQTTALSIKGKVIDSQTKEPLQYVKVTAKFKAGKAWAEKVKSTTHLGNFQFKGLPNGKCTLTFELEYYNKSVTEIAVHSGTTTELYLKLIKISNE